MDERAIRDLFAKHAVELAGDDVWRVQGTPVIRHKALERLSGALRVTWAPPQILRAERDEAVILATGSLPDGASDWSIGECLQTDGTRPGNYRIAGKQAPYVYAMAEKRAKDRVILKLAGLHGAYSEDEADDFKRPDEPAPPRPAPVVSSGTPRGEAKGPSLEAQNMASDVKACRSDADLVALKRQPEFQAFWKEADAIDREFVTKTATAVTSKFARAA